MYRKNLLVKDLKKDLVGSFVNYLTLWRKKKLIKTNIEYIGGNMCSLKI